MPVTVNERGLDTFIEGIRQRVESPDMIVALGNSLSNHLVESLESSGLTSRSGATVRALSFVGKPERTSSGWRIGVGDKSATGLPSDSAPRGTLRAFFDDHKDIKPSKWRYMKQSTKDILEGMRRAGMYGGRGQNYANYMWVQDKGDMSDKVRIPARGFVNTGLTAFRSEAPNIIQSHLVGRA